MSQNGIRHIQCVAVWPHGQIILHIGRVGTPAQAYFDCSDLVACAYVEDRPPDDAYFRYVVVRLDWHFWRVVPQIAISVCRGLLV